MRLALLLIEDNPGDARLIRELLIEAGAGDWRLVVVERLSQGIARLRDGDIDAVLLDLSLPDSQGLASFCLLHQQAPELPVVVLSGLDDETVALSAVQQGAQDYLVKGAVDGHLLVRALRYAVERQKARTAQALLVRASTLLATSRDDLAIIGNIVELVVPRLADYCIFDLIDERGEVERVAVAHADPGQAALAQALVAYPPQLAADDALTAPLWRGQTLRFDGLGPAELATFASDEHHLDLLHQLAPTAVLWVPLLTRGRLLGTLLLVLTGSGRQYQADDLWLIEELAYRCALALENAGYYRLEQQARAVAERLAAELNELERQKDEFFANLSHDLRTPVTGIKASIEVVLTHLPPELPAPLRRMLVNIDQAATRMAGLVDDLLELSRLQAGRLQLQPQRCDLREVAEQALRAIEPLAERRQQRLEVHLPAAPIWLEADPARLERVLVNLLGNANKHGPAGGRIGLAIAVQAEQVELTVTDDGPGIPVVEQARIFERFVRLDQAVSQQTPGSGLGLAIARALVELHGGQIGIRDQPGAGTLFWLRLPLAECQPSPVAVERAG